MNADLSFILFIVQKLLFSIDCLYKQIKGAQIGVSDLSMLTA